MYVPWKRRRKSGELANLKVLCVQPCQARAVRAYTLRLSAPTSSRSHTCTDLPDVGARDVDRKSI